MDKVLTQKWRKVAVKNEMNLENWRNKYCSTSILQAGRGRVGGKLGWMYGLPISINKYIILIYLNGYIVDKL